MIGPQSFTSLRLTRWPRPISPNEYVSAASELEEALTTVPGAVAVYRFGSIGAPGISDLDRIVVVEDGGPPIPDLWRALSEQTRQVAMHSPFAAPVGGFV